MKNRKSQQRNMKEEKDQMEILTLIKYSSQNKKLSGWAQEQNEGEKESVNLKIDQEKLPNQNSRQKIDGGRGDREEQSLRDLGYRKNNDLIFIYVLESLKVFEEIMTENS